MAKSIWDALQTSIGTVLFLAIYLTSLTIYFVAKKIEAQTIKVIVWCQNIFIICSLNVTHVPDHRRHSDKEKEEKLIICIERVARAIDTVH